MIKNLALILPATLAYASSITATCAQTTITNEVQYELTIRLAPTDPKEVELSSHRNVNSQIENGVYTTSFPNVPKQISILVKWLKDGKEAARQLKLIPLNTDDRKSIVGISYISFNLDSGLQGIEQLLQIPTESPYYYDKYLTAKAAVSYFYYKTLRDRFGKRVLQALAIWYKEANRLADPQQEIPFTLDKDVELEEVLRWSVLRFKREDLKEYVCYNEEKCITDIEAKFKR